MKKMHVSAVAIIILGLLAVTCYAETVKERMKSRLPAIVDLKAKGLIGETNQGFIGYPNPATEPIDIVQAENADRTSVYEAIAREQGTTTDQVGQRRAAQIAEKATPGDWLQDSKGNWYQMK